MGPACSRWHCWGDRGWRGLPKDTSPGQATTPPLPHHIRTQNYPTSPNGEVRPQTAIPLGGEREIFFSIKGCDPPALTSLLLLLAGDIETNPGPTTYTCHICTQKITTRHYSLKCNACTQWVHLRCTTLTSYKQYTNTWTCGCLPQPPPYPIPTTPTPTLPNHPTSTTPLPPQHPQPPPQQHPQTPPQHPQPPPQHPQPPPPQHPQTPPQHPQTPPQQPLPPPQHPQAPPQHPQAPPQPPAPHHLQLPPQHPQPVQQHSQPPRNTHTTQHNTATQQNTLNIIQLNINGITNKHKELQHFLHKHNTHIALIQETKLRHTSKTPQILNYTTLRQDRQNAQGGGLIILIHKNIPFTNTTQHTKQLTHNDNTLEIQSIQTKLHNTTYNIVNTYIPPPASCPPQYTPQLHNITTLPNLFFGGDFNAHHTTWLTTHNNDTRGTLILDQLHSLNTLNISNKPTRHPPNAAHQSTSPDITFCTPALHTRSTWDIIHDLPSDHLPIQITYQLQHPTHTKYTKTYTNYKKANWPLFTQYIEDKLENFMLESHNSLNHTTAHLNKIIQQASQKHIPQGFRKHFNPNFSPQIHNLIRQRNILRQNRTPSQQEIEQIQTLNNRITNLITDKQTTNWKNYLETINHRTSSKKLWRTLKNIDTSQNSPSPTHESLSTNNTVTSDKQQANILMKHYAKISQKPTTHTNRIVTKSLRKMKTITNAPTPFTTAEVTRTIKSLNNSHSTGTDKISNIHLKHLGPNALQVITDIFNYSWLHNTIPNIWKHATIIPILKPGKPPSQPSSYRPISLLPTISKVLERLVLQRINPDIPLSISQHGFRPKHSTTTLHTILTQHILDGFNQALPPSRTVMAAIDISKAFDTVPRHTLIGKILNTTLHNNDKKWLANFISGRHAHVTYNNYTSKTRTLPNGVPQGAVLSPTLFNLFLHDLPQPNPAHETHILSYADDLTITSQHPKVQQATNHLQEYLLQLEQWLLQNRMTVSPQKSSITLLTPDRHESRLQPHVTLFNEPLPLNRTPKILGVTYDTHMTFTSHTENTNTRASQKLNALRTLTGKDFGQQKETLSILYKQFIRTSIHYASQAWTPSTSNTNMNKLQTTQNKALKIITGCTQTTNTNHTHAETKILPLKTHLDMIGTQFYSSAQDPLHPCHSLTHHPLPPRNKKQTPAQYYNHTYNNIPPTPPNTNTHKHIHTYLTQQTINNRPHNTILNSPPPKINTSENTLPRETRVTLARLRSGHHPSLQDYKHRIDQTQDPSCPRCQHPTDNTEHLILHCPTLAPHRHNFNITSLRDLWTHPREVANYLDAAGFP